MKLSTFVSFFALGATALARPLYQEGDANLARRTDAPTSTDTATATATATDSVSTTSASSSSATPTDTFLYSTITNTDSLSWSTYTQTQPESTNTVSTSTSTEYPQSTSGVVESVQITEIIHVFETIKVTEVVVVQQPVFIAVQVNVFVQQQIFVNQFQQVFINRFNQWDPNVVGQLGLIISQQYEVLVRASNSGFQSFNNDNFNAFVGKFVEQFQVFQSIQLVDVQQFVTVVHGFSISQLGSFYGRSDALFSQAIFEQFSINNDFSVFVQQLSPMIDAISSSAFNSDGIFELNDSLLVSGLSLSSF